MTNVHVVGAGMAGLACAVHLAEAGHTVVLYDAAPQAGGRARSYHDEGLDRRIDNGSHLLFSANRAALSYLKTIGALDAIADPGEAAFPFVDLESGRRWTVRMNPGRMPWWLFNPHARVPGLRLRDLGGLRRLARAGRKAVVTDCVDRTAALYRNFWEPLTLAVLNTPPEQASARLLWRMLAESVMRGGRFCRPLIARDCLAAALVDPALAFIRARGGTICFGHRVRAIEVSAGNASRIDFVQGWEPLTPEDRLVVALPAPNARALLPDLEVPEGHHAIVNAHFAVEPARDGPAEPRLVGLLGGVGHWLFVRPNLISVTVSAADGLADRPAAMLLPELWAEAARALALPSRPVPPGRLIREKRATYAQTPANAARRPGPRTALGNVLLAGDWTDTGLPATIEGAIRSGERAAALCD